MWLRLLLTELCAPLAALVGSDGYLYWRVLDLAQLLGRRNVYNFAKTVVGSVRGRDVLVFPDVAASEITLRSQLVDTRQAYELLLRKNPPLARAFEHALLGGRARLTMPTKPGLSHKVAPLLTVMDDGDVDIQSWIQEYTAVALQVFEMSAATRRRPEEQHEGGGARDVKEEEDSPQEGGGTQDDGIVMDLEDTQPLPAAAPQEASTWIPEGLDAEGVYQSHLRPTDIFNSMVNRGEWLVRVNDADRELPPTLFVLCGSRMERYVVATGAGTGRGREPAAGHQP